MAVLRRRGRGRERDGDRSGGSDLDREAVAAAVLVLDAAEEALGTRPELFEGPEPVLAGAGPDAYSFALLIDDPAWTGTLVARCSPAGVLGREAAWIGALGRAGYPVPEIVADHHEHGVVVFRPPEGTNLASAMVDDFMAVPQFLAALGRLHARLHALDLAELGLVTPPAAATMTKPATVTGPTTVTAPATVTDPATVTEPGTVADAAAVVVPGTVADAAAGADRAEPGLADLAAVTDRAAASGGRRHPVDELLERAGAAAVRAEVDAELTWLDKSRPAEDARPLVPCHGDLNPVHVYVAGGDPATAVPVNWTRARAAEAAFDVAGTVTAFWTGPLYVDGTVQRTALKMIRDSLISAYLKHYSEASAQVLDDEALRYWQAFHVAALAVDLARRLHGQPPGPWDPAANVTKPADAIQDLRGRFRELADS